MKKLDWSQIKLSDIKRIYTIGKWIDKPTGYHGRWQSWCSICGKHNGINGIMKNRHKPFCPNCGSKMVVDENE